MNNFIFENKTKVYFGKDGVKEYHLSHGVHPPLHHRYRVRHRQ